MTKHGRIVVGIDGSPPSRDALRWALGEAECRDCELEAVHAWQYPALAYVPGLAPTPVFADDDMEAEAWAVLDETVEKVLADRGCGTEVQRVVVHGSPVEALAARARGADLLVVGHRGGGGFRELLLGSVAKQCAANAPCPVVIVRPSADGMERLL
jgi:nucleotide-binding universal stress UspA family protein